MTEEEVKVRLVALYREWQLHKADDDQDGGRPSSIWTLTALSNIGELVVENFHMFIAPAPPSTSDNK